MQNTPNIEMGEYARQQIAQNGRNMLAASNLAVAFNVSFKTAWLLICAV